MKNLNLVFLAVILTGCGSSGGNSSGGDTTSSSEAASVADCVVTMSTVSLESGDTCTLNKSDADLFSISAGEISCDSGAINYNGNSFSSGANGFTFNGLTIACGS